MDGNAMEWFTWVVDNPVAAGSAAAGVAVTVLLVIVMARLAFAALGRRLLVGLGLRKKIAKESPWATLDERVLYGLRPAPRRWWAFWRRA